MLDAALAYAAQGLKVFPCYSVTWQAEAGSVVPHCTCRRAGACRQMGKHPRFAKGTFEHGHKDATSDPAQLTDWFTRWPLSNIGLATGEGSGITIVDVDGAEGEAKLAELEAAYRARGGTVSTETLAVITGSGRHLYYRYSGERSSAKAKLDIRGDGGYAILPPSNHKSGRTYQWDTRHSLRDLPEYLKEWADAGAAPKEIAPLIPAPAPDWLKAAPQQNYGIAAKAARNLRPVYDPVDVSDVESALACLSPIMDDKPWHEIGMALKSLGWERPDGTDLGFALWDAWSQGSPQYDLHALETRWRSFGRREGGKQIGIGTLFSMAKKAGWIRPFRQPEQEVVTHAVGPASAGPNRTNNAQPSSVASAPAGAVTAPSAYQNGHSSLSAGTALVPATIAAPARPIRWIDRDDDGNPKTTCTNTRLALEHLGVTCRKDVFHEKMIVGGAPIQQWAGDLSDDVVHILRRVIKDTYGFDPQERNARDAAVQLCLMHQFNPVTDYLASQAWDGVPRLASWMPKYLGAPNSRYTQEVGRLTLLAAVRRAREPGCKFDQIIVLEGAEGTGKSAAIRILAGEENFSDQRLLGANDKEQQEAMTGVWLYELAELEGLRRADVERIKQFASRTEDRARPAYGRLRVDRKRTCVFIATTNEEDYLKGTTGNRRFWPVKTGHIDLAGLKADRNQLWAEAAYLESMVIDGMAASIGLDRDLWALAAEEQHERLEGDSWEDDVRHYLEKHKPESVSVRDILTGQPLLLQPREINQIAFSRVARILIKMRWERYRQRAEGGFQWRYRPRGK